MNGLSKQQQTTQEPAKAGRRVLRGLVPLVVFLVLTSFLEILIVVYAMRLGVQDTNPLQVGSVSISLLFEVVPICVVITLGFCWVYLTKRLSTKRQEIRRGKIETFARAKGGKRGFLSRLRRAGGNISKGAKTGYSRISRFSERTRIGRPTVKSAVIVLLLFSVFIIMFSLFAYPQTIYHGVQYFYRSNPGAESFVISVDNWAKGVFGGAFSPISNGLLASSSGFANFASSVGDLLGPIASLDNAGKYLAFQNAAVWISVLLVLLFGERAGRGYRYKK